MMHKAWRSLEQAPYCFSRSFVKFKVTWDKNSLILNRIGRFRTVTPVWIHRQVWYDAQSLHGHGRGSLLFPQVNCQISRPYGPNNQLFHGFGSGLNRITMPVAAIKSLGFALFLSRWDLPTRTHFLFGWLLDREVTCWLLYVKPIPKRTLIYCYLNPQKQICGDLDQNTEFTFSKVHLKCSLYMLAHLCLRDVSQ